MTDESHTSGNGPRLEVLDRVKNIPTIHTALEKTESTYSYLKGSHHLINWALTYAEAGLNYATATAVPIAAPLAKKFESRINNVDEKLCQGLNIVEKRIPIVKQPPQEIYMAARKVMECKLQPTVEKMVSAKESAAQQASALKNISIAKANEILDTHYGTMAVQGLDSTSALVNRLLDYYFPPIQDEVNPPAPVSTDENKVLHAVQTIGQLSSKTANRIYHSIAAQLQTIKKEEVTNYISSVVAILHLTQFLDSDQEQPTPSTPSASEGEKGPSIEHH